MERSLQWSRPASLLLFAAAFLAAAAVASADITDEQWKRRKAEQEAKPNRAAYNPDPFSVVNHFNRAVHRHACRRST
ncbi:hypothetical protein ACUV84_012008 [Puccinellia chinampoensis]